MMPSPVPRQVAEPALVKQLVGLLHGMDFGQIACQSPSARLVVAGQFLCGGDSVELGSIGLSFRTVCQAKKLVRVAHRDQPACLGHSSNVQRAHVPW